MLPFDPADLDYAPLSAECPREAFSCGADVVDRWFREKAPTQHTGHHCRVTVANAPNLQNPVAFYALSITTERLADRWSIIPNAPWNKESYFPALHLEWVGVQEDFQGAGLGTLLMGHVLSIYKDLVTQTGLPALTLKPLNDRTAAFYERLGFVHFGPKVLGPRMMLPASKVIDAAAAA